MRHVSDKAAPHLARFGFWRRAVHDEATNSLDDAVFDENHGRRPAALVAIPGRSGDPKSAMGARNRAFNLIQLTKAWALRHRENVRQRAVDGSSHHSREDRKIVTEEVPT